MKTTKLGEKMLTRETKDILKEQLMYYSQTILQLVRDDITNQYSIWASEEDRVLSLAKGIYDSISLIIKNKEAKCG